MEEKISAVVERVAGRAVPVRGNDIDTDRIVPARYLRAVTFEGLGEHAFEDDRRGGPHSFDDPQYKGSSVLLVNANFGCGSSREHAPQALQRWGIDAIVGESFAEIFLGNCTAMGIPCVAVSASDVESIMAAVEADPGLEIAVSLGDMSVKCDGHSYAVQMPDGMRKQLVQGLWDGAGMLLKNMDLVKEMASKLPYVAGFKSFI